MPRLCLLTVFLLALLSPAAAQGIKTLGPPPGFEETLGPQTTMVDVYYGQAFLISTLADFTADYVQFRQPARITAAIADLREPAQVERLLAEPLDPHSERICHEPNQALCQRLEPDTVGIVFDERRFRVDLFIHPDLLKRPEPPGKRYLPPPEHNELTAVQHLRTLYTNATGSAERYSVFGRTRVAKGNGFGFADWASTGEQNFSVDELGYHRDFADHQFTAGLFEPRVDMLRALSRDPLLGVGFGSSLRLRTDLDAAIASPVEVFLPSRSRVDILRDGRLVSSGFYDVGNQFIDTSQLPAGSYPIDIVITDAGGAVRREQQLYVKSSLLPPPEEPQWVVEFGDLRRRSGERSRFPESYDTPLLKAAYRWRQNQRLGFGVAAASTGDTHLGEVSSDMLWTGFQAGLEAFRSSGGGWGYGLRAAGRWRELLISANAQRVEPDAFSSTKRYRLLSNPQKLYSLQASIPAPRGQLSFTASHRQQVGGRDRQRHSLRYSGGYSLPSRRQLSWHIEAGEESGDWFGKVTFHWRQQRNQWRDHVRVGYSDDSLIDNHQGWAGALGTLWQDTNHPLGHVTFGANLESSPDNQTTAGLLAEQRSSLGRFNAETTATNGTTASGDTQYSGVASFETSLLLDQHGGLTAGGHTPGDAGVVINLDGAPDNNVDLFVDGSRYLSGAQGREAIVLPGYRQYRITLNERSEGSALVSFDATPRSLVLYPGQVINHHWELTTIQILVGRVWVACDPVNNMPVESAVEEQCLLTNAWIDGVEGYALTDAEGYLQAEISSSTRTLSAQWQGKSCDISIDGIIPRNNILRADRLVCRFTH